MRDASFCSDTHTLQCVKQSDHSNISSVSFVLPPTDKATSTDDISPRFPYSMDVADALSQLSYNSEVFEEMFKRSTDNDRVSKAASTSSQEVRASFISFLSFFS